MTDKKQKKVYLPEELSNVLDAHPRSNSSIVESALSAYLNTGELRDVERRLDELSNEQANVESQRNERNRKLEEINEQRRALEQRRDSLQKKHEREEENLSKAISNCEGAPRDPTNGAIKKQAKRVNMTPEEFIDELPERDDGGPRSL